jgi:F-type H+-transporting ATPase subunit gamma
MAGQKEIRSRIASTISTQQITKAMKLVSATKLRKASEAIVRMRPYAEKLQGIMANLQESADDDRLAVYFQAREVKSAAVIVITSDRGLCGAFNANVVKRVRAMAASELASKKVHYICIGKKGAEALKRLGFEIDTRFVNALNGLSADSAFELASVILNEFKAGQYDQVTVVYNRFKNAATQILSADAFLPVAAQTSVQGSSQSDYLFEPSKVAILEDLIPRSLKTQLYRSMLDSLASEHGARMIAMDKATDNAGELLRSLRLAYNQARQAAITREISEIVGGVAALEGA